MVVVINTLDTDFERDAVQYCRDNLIEYYVTDSDGTPSTGKNALLDVFENSLADYAVMVDGDDIITEYGVRLYQHASTKPDAPDVIAIINQHGIKMGLSHYMNPPPEVITDDHGDIDPESIEPLMTRPFDRKRDFEVILADDRITGVQKDWAHYSVNYISPDENHLRVTFLSKKAARMFRFNELVVGEDTCMYLLYRDAHFRGQLRMIHHNETDNPTYLYDLRLGGTVTANGEKDESGCPQWMAPMIDKFKEYEEQGKLWKIA